MTYHIYLDTNTIAYAIRAAKASEDSTGLLILDYFRDIAARQNAILAITSSVSGEVLRGPQAEEFENWLTTNGSYISEAKVLRFV